MKLGILICTYNRPQYLKQCLESLERADIPKGTLILIVDDASTDQETISLIKSFRWPTNCFFSVNAKSKNLSIKDSILQGCDQLFEFKADVVINLDGDAIVRHDFIDVLLKLKKQFPKNIITGFNCLTRNRDGSERHKVLETGDGYTKRKSVGGINMLFDKKQYNKWVRPTLVKCLEQGGNWDDHTCRASMADGFEIITSSPSVVQHIGIESAMGHSAGGEPPDVASDFVDDEDLKLFEREFYVQKQEIETEKFKKHLFRKLQLPNVTLICAEGVNVERCIHAANISCRDIEFGAVKILSHLPSADPRVIKIRPLADKKDYSQFILKEIVDYVDTDFMLIFQYDGFVLNASAWDEEFFNWDMIGAVWKFRPEKRTANGGFSLRSRRMMQIISDDDAIYLQNDHIIRNFAEDHVLFYIYRSYLENNYDIKIAPEELCDKFSFEGWGEKPPANKYQDSFGFHGFSIDFSDAKLPYVPYLLPNKQIL